MKVDVFIHLEGRRSLVGQLSDTQKGIAFQYATSFVTSKLQLSPISMPLQASIWVQETHLFGGLPGFIADSLPDGWGNLLLDRKLQSKGLSLANFSPLQRLCATGSSGMGALEYEPADEGGSIDFEEINLDFLSDGVDDILADQNSDSVLDDLSFMNGSSGGARPKIVCLVSSDFQKLIPGHCAQENFRPWLIKFLNSTDPVDGGALEYAVSVLARQAGINIGRTHLFASKKGPGWFGIERFDRTDKGKIHMVTAAGLLHCDFRLPCLDYKTLMILTQRLCAQADVIEMLRRAYFNFVIGNADDHAKNFSFLIDAAGVWHLSPAYDLVPTKTMYGEHTTSLNGKGKNVARSDFINLGQQFDLTSTQVEAVLDGVDACLSGWKQLALDCGVRRPPVFQPVH